MSAHRPVAIITGAARRVGRAIAVELARSEFDLILTFNRSRDEIEETCEACRNAAGDSIGIGAHKVDLADADALIEIAQEWMLLPRIDALVHNASSYAPSPLDDLTLDDLLFHFRVNAAAPAVLSCALRHQLQSSALEGGGSVVCFSDIHVLGRPRTHHLAYAMSKAALTQMVETLAVELAPGVRVNAIAPGVVAWPDDADRAEVAAYERRIPLRRPGTPEDAARLVRWLITSATYITGEVIRLDGGRWLR